MPNFLYKFDSEYYVHERNNEQLVKLVNYEARSRFWFLCKKSRKNHSQWCLIGLELGVIGVVINRAENGQGENERLGGY